MIILLIYDVDIDSSKFDKLFNIVEMLPNNIDFGITLIKLGKDISFGDGTKREFMELAINEFAEKYLIKHNVCTEFNTSALEILSDHQLIIIGSMLHAIICHNLNNLPIRLPIIFISSLLSNLAPNTSELEYFAKMEDPEAFYTIYKIRYDPEIIASTGYESYNKCLKILSKYCHEDDTTDILAKKISDKIAIGFKTYGDIENIEMMNYPTLDYFLSGPYVIDRQLIIKKLIVSSDDNKSNSYKNQILNIIKTLPEDKLAILIKNWSGTVVVKKTYDYIVRIVNKAERFDYFFGTCNIELVIKKKMMKNPLLVELLTTPINSIVDI